VTGASGGRLAGRVTSLAGMEEGNRHNGWRWAEHPASDCMHSSRARAHLSSSPLDRQFTMHEHPSLGSVDSPPEYSSVPIAPSVPTQPIEPLAAAPDGNPQLNSDANIVAQTVEPPPDPAISTDVQLDLKDPEIRDIGWNRDMGELPPTLVHGLSNDDLFTFIRRFNKVCSASRSLDGSLLIWLVSLANIPCQSHSRSASRSTGP